MKSYFNFKPGDVVELKSGGLPISVVGCDGRGVDCQWQDAEGRPQSAIWSAAAVKPRPETSNSESNFINNKPAVALVPPRITTITEP